jgi:peroxiredoxin
MTAMRLNLAVAVWVLAATRAFAASPQITEANFRKNLSIPATVRMEYRDLDCKPVTFDGFAQAMGKPGAHADMERAADGSSVTLSVKRRGGAACPSTYPPVTEMPPFDLRDLSGKRVTSASLKGKPTLISFFFSTCVPCILEVGPINKFAAERPNINFLAVTFDEPEVAQAFVKRYGLRWRVVPDARDFVDRFRVKQYPLMALFDANGRLLGTKKGGARDELEAANVEPQLKRWMEGLLRK